MVPLFSAIAAAIYTAILVSDDMSNQVIGFYYGFFVVILVCVVLSHLFENKDTRKDAKEVLGPLFAAIPISSLSIVLVGGELLDIKKTWLTLISLVSLVAVLLIYLSGKNESDSTIRKNSASK